MSKKYTLKLQKSFNQLIREFMYNKAIIWQHIPASMKGSFQCDRFRSVSLMNIQIDVVSLMITDGKFPLHGERRKEDLS